MDSEKLMIEFSWPWVFALLPFPFLVRRFLPPAPVTRAGSLRVPFFDELAETRNRTGLSRGARLPLLLAASLAWILLVTAAARPIHIGAPRSLPAAGRDLMLAIDLSGSMAREDFTMGGRRADRLTVVKHVAEDFLTRRKGDRVGLVLFGTRAYLQAPLTFDRETVGQFLAEAEVGLPGQETAIGDALGTSILRLRERPEDSRVLILLTDGANNAGALDPREAASLAAAEGIRIHTIGVGADTGVRQGLFGRRIVNPSADLDEQLLQDIADATGGEYFRARNAEALAQVYREIDRIEPTEGDPRTTRPRKDLFAWPLGLTVALSFGIAATRPGMFSSPSVSSDGEENSWT
jgi:Ca-activated chloride channel family protein